MNIEELKGLPILKAHFKKLADVSKAAFTALRLPYVTIGVVYGQADEDRMVVMDVMGDSLRVIKSETKKRGWKIESIHYADIFETKNYGGSTNGLLEAALEALTVPEVTNAKPLKGKYVVKLDINDNPMCFLMEDNDYQDELTEEEFSTLWESKGETFIIPEGTTAIEERAFRNFQDLKSIVIPGSVTTIGESAFEGCTGLTSIVIPDSVKKIGRGAFWNCTELTSIVIPDSVTEIADSAFRNCSNLTSIVIPNSVTEIDDSAFEGCTGLTSIVIPDSVTKIGYGMLQRCTGLTSIVVSGGNKVYDSRDNCNAIIETATNKLLIGCQLTIIPNSVTEIYDGAFKGCTGLTSIVIPDSVTGIGGSAFASCKMLESITLPSSLSTLGTYVFSHCSTLASIIIPSSVTTIDCGTFEGCTSLASVTIEGPVEKIEEDAFNGCTSLKTLTLATGIKKISKKAFEGCTAIERINVPAKKADYYKKRLPEALHAFIVEQ